MHGQVKKQGQSISQLQQSEDKLESSLLQQKQAIQDIVALELQ
jgi:hypothetical protein